MNFPIARELPYGYGATLSGRNTNIFFLTSNFSKIAQSYSSRDEIRAYNSSCDNCTSTVQVSLLLGSFLVHSTTNSAAVRGLASRSIALRGLVDSI